MNRPRRDPRSERAAHAVPAGGRPRFDLATDVPLTRRRRRDPRGEFARALVPGAARLRLDRGQTGPSDFVMAYAVDAKPEAPQLRTVETPAFLVFAVLDAGEGRLGRFDRQVLGAARLLADAGQGGKAGGGAVVAVVSQPIEGLGSAGADRMVSALGRSMDAADEAPIVDDPASRARRLAALVAEHEPRHVVFAETAEGGDLARRLAARLGEPILTEVEYLTARTASRASRGGRREQAGAPPRLMAICEDRVADYAGIPCEARQIAGPAEAPSSGEGPVLSVEIIPGDPATMSLAETDFVVSAGNGVTDFTAFRELAAALQATPGASRVVCDAGLMPREAQVGASGTVLTADCYLALGIAGAPQHLQGIAGCEHVIAVNTDLHAAMVERAGLAIVQDAQLVMPALLTLLKERAS